MKVNNAYHLFSESFILIDFTEALKKDTKPSPAFWKRVRWSVKDCILGKILLLLIFKMSLRATKKDLSESDNDRRKIIKT